MMSAIIPEPESKFYKVKCPECSHEMVIFSHAKMRVKCLRCDALIAEPTGGKAIIKAEIIEEYQ